MISAIQDIIKTWRAKLQEYEPVFKELLLQKDYVKELLAQHYYAAEVNVYEAAALWHRTHELKPVLTKLGTIISSYWFLFVHFLEWLEDFTINIKEPFIGAYEDFCSFYWFENLIVFFVVSALLLFLLSLLLTSGRAKLLAKDIINTWSDYSIDIKSILNEFPRFYFLVKVLKFSLIVIMFWLLNYSNNCVAVFIRCVVLDVFCSIADFVIYTDCCFRTYVLSRPVQDFQQPNFWYIRLFLFIKWVYDSLLDLFNFYITPFTLLNKTSEIESPLYLFMRISTDFPIFFGDSWPLFRRLCWCWFFAHLVRRLFALFFWGLVWVIEYTLCEGYKRRAILWWWILYQDPVLALVLYYRRPIYRGYRFCFVAQTHYFFFAYYTWIVAPLTFLFMCFLLFGLLLIIEQEHDLKWIVTPNEGWILKDKLKFDWKKFETEDCYYASKPWLRRGYPYLNGLDDIDPWDDSQRIADFPVYKKYDRTYWHIKIETVLRKIRVPEIWRAIFWDIEYDVWPIYLELRRRGYWRRFKNILTFLSIAFFIFGFKSILALWLTCKIFLIFQLFAKRPEKIRYMETFDDGWDFLENWYFFRPLFMYVLVLVLLFSSTKCWALLLFILVAWVRWGLIFRITGKHISLDPFHYITLDTLVYMGIVYFTILFHVACMHICWAYPVDYSVLDWWVWDYLRSITFFSTLCRIFWIVYLVITFLLTPVTLWVNFSVENWTPLDLDPSLLQFDNFVTCFFLVFGVYIKPDSSAISSLIYDWVMCLHDTCWFIEYLPMIV